jgi:hypothetical protein
MNNKRKMKKKKKTRKGRVRMNTVDIFVSIYENRRMKQ